ncbi:MAG: hypothetical protein E5X49_07660 [Mesorhizobium sp.]|nr:MAG: hypothetical protein EOR43_07820 [Mesorhizobium sp.]RWK33039.1 MAG: hypothetical protein EOR44_09865 [Mesorhizobium sp.]TIQ44784.1 MAG: hypothetical protein E5X49_07660 [Mesorhizobium sp.]
MPASPPPNRCSRGFFSGRDSNAEPLADASDHTLAEIDWLARNERVVHLPDIVMRRTVLAITGRLSQRDLEPDCRHRSGRAGVQRRTARKRTGGDFNGTRGAASLLPLNSRNRCLPGSTAEAEGQRSQLPSGWLRARGPAKLAPSRMLPRR